MPVSTNRQVLLLFGLFLSALSVAVPAAEPPLTLLTEHNPPAEYLDEQGNVGGVTTQLLQLLMQRLNVQGTFALMPWGRAFSMARSGSNVALYETVRTAEREALFKWVGPLMLYRISLYSLAGRVPSNIPAHQLADNYVACNYPGAASVRELQQLGFVDGKNLVLTSKSGDCLNMLLLGRVDLLAIEDSSLAEYQATASQSGKSLTEVLFLSERQRYLAFSLDVSNEHINRWQQALEQSYRDGSMRKLYQPVYSDAIIQRLEQFAAQPPQPH